MFSSVQRDITSSCRLQIAPAFLAWSIATFSCAAVAHAAQIIYVDDDAPSIGGDGTSWKSAYNNLQDALAIAQAGDEIRIAQGTYKPAPPNGPREATFNLVDGVIIQGGYAGLTGDDPDALDWEKYPTILSGDLNGDDGPNLTVMSDNVFHVVSAVATSDATTMQGLVIRGGNADGPQSGGGDGHGHGGGIVSRQMGTFALRDSIVEFNRAFTDGGGVSGTGVALIIERCIIRNNRTIMFFPSSGAGVSAGPQSQIRQTTFRDNGPSYSGSGIIAQNALIDGCSFYSNHSYEDGGAISGSNLTIRNCYVTESSSGVQGGAARLTGTTILYNTVFERNHGYQGGAIYALGSLTIVNCMFHQNDANQNAGAVSGQQLTIVNSTFTENRWTGSVSGAAGAVEASQSLHAVNCLFAKNESAWRGGALRLYGQSELVNCTIVDNITSSNISGGAVSQMNGTLTMSNCIIYDNVNGGSQSQSAQVWLNAGAVSTILNSCIEGWDGSINDSPNCGNHGNDPRFVDPDNGDFRLRPNSPCIEGGNNSALPTDEFDLDSDGDTSESIPFDLDWLPRIVNRNVDLGAFEFQGSPCRADINGDSTVNVADLLPLLEAWGACIAGQSCDTDLNLDGTVNVDDLVFMLANWGECSA